MNIVYRSFTSKRLFGVELETSNTKKKAQIKKAIGEISAVPVLMSCYGNSVDNVDWEIKDDFSCGPDGFEGAPGCEIVSPVSSGLESIDHIARVAENLKKRHIEINEHCGFHVHANAADLTPEQVGVVVAYWLKIEQILSMAVPVSRFSNRYCAKIGARMRWIIDRQKKYTGEQLWDLAKPTDLSLTGSEDRRVNLNLVNYARGVWLKERHKRRTLELRWPEGTLDYLNVKCWPILFLNFIDNVKDRPMPTSLGYSDLEETLAILGLHHDDEDFVILSEELLETKTWLLSRIARYMGEKVSTKTTGYFTSDVRLGMGRAANQVLNSMWNPLKKYG